MARRDGGNARSNAAQIEHRELGTCKGEKSK
jgi:hypothetical protein